MAFLSVSERIFNEGHREPFTMLSPFKAVHAFSFQLI